MVRVGSKWRKERKKGKDQDGRKKEKREARGAKADRFRRFVNFKGLEDSVRVIGTIGGGAVCGAGLWGAVVLFPQQGVHNRWGVRSAGWIGAPAGPHQVLEIDGMLGFDFGP